MYDTILLGAGAAGLMCALTAGRRGRRVLVLERANKPGKKILMSGAGRCNFTNLHIAPECFLSANPHFCKSALSGYTQWDFIDLVQRHRIEYFEKQTVAGPSGQLFCRDSSRLIVAMLMKECQAAGVVVRTACETAAVQCNGAFCVQTNQGEFVAPTLVVAAGGLSIPSLGGSDFGYRLARQFGLRLLPRSAGLVPLTFTDATGDLCQRLAGTSCEVVVSNARASFHEDLLFTHRGLSGPASLQISSYWRPGECISIDLLPGQDAHRVLRAWKQHQPTSLLRTRLSELLPRKLVETVERLFWPRVAERVLAQWPDRQLDAAVVLR